MSSHRILLLNFTEKEALNVEKAGFNVERGVMGLPDMNWEFCPFAIPRPIYEYEVMFYNSCLDRSPDLVSELENPRNLLNEKGSFRALAQLDGPPSVRVAFVGNTKAEDIIPGGIPGVTLEDADRNVSTFVEFQRDTFTIDALHKLIVGFKNQITSVGQFYSAAYSHPLHHLRVLGSRDYKAIAGYGTRYQRELPHYIILPQVKDFPRAIIETLHCLETLSPSLFPDRIRQDWINSDEFLLPNERRIKEEIAGIVSAAQVAVQAKETELAAASAANSFIRDLLTSLEDKNNEPGKQLSAVVKKALEFLEFEVDDIDAKTKSKIKKEDFWVREGNFLAITEVTGTVNKNPKIKEYNDILGRMNTIYKRKTDLCLPAGAETCGLLILAYDVKTHPSRRPKAYTGEDQHIIDAAAEQEIGVLSTVELHKIVVAVTEGRLSKIAARALIKEPGRIEFLPNESKPTVDNDAKS
jgi:hypothetical protein